MGLRWRARRRPCGTPPRAASLRGRPVRRWRATAWVRGGSGSAWTVKISTTRSKDPAHSARSASRSATRNSAPVPPCRSRRHLDGGRGQVEAEHVETEASSGTPRRRRARNRPPRRADRCRRARWSRPTLAQQRVRRWCGPTASRGARPGPRRTIRSNHSVGRPASIAAAVQLVGPPVPVPRLTTPAHGFDPSDEPAPSFVEHVSQHRAPLVGRAGCAATVSRQLHPPTNDL